MKIFLDIYKCFNRFLMDVFTYSFYIIFRDLFIDLK